MSSELVFHPLQNKWNFYIHLHDNKDWSFKSYINMVTIKNIEEAILLNDEIHYDLIKKTMMFIMKENIKPMWEDPHNRDGGCFSFKVLNKDIAQVWKKISYCVLGQCFTKEYEHNDFINGITVSPKKKFCILKVWMRDCHLKDPDIFIPVENLDSKGCLFKQHCPEY